MVIPPIRFVKEGQIDRDIFALIRANFRGTKEISGDFRAQTAANRLGWQRLQAMLEKYGGMEFERYLDALLDCTERRTTDAFAQFPDGVFRAESYMIVCCFLHSYVNPAHERLAADIIRAEYPEAFLSVSSDVCPEFREYLRAGTTAVNAAIMPLVSRYLDALESRLQTRGIPAPF